MTLALFAFFVILSSLPGYACWWSYYDDWYDYDNSYDSYSYDYYDDYDYDDSYDYYDDYSYYDYSCYDYDDYSYYDYDDYDYDNYDDSCDNIYSDSDYDEGSSDDYAWDITMDDIKITGHDSFWDDPIFQEDNSWLNDGYDPNDYADPPSNESESSDPTWEDSGNGGGEQADNIGSYHPNNNATTTEITPPLLPQEYHQPESHEKLFKDNLPAQTLKQECKMTCVPTAMASIISMLGSDWSAEEIRDQIEQNYLNTKPEGYDLCKYGVLKVDLDNVMYKASFYETSINEIRNNIDEGNPCAAVINIGTNITEELHMIEIVGYFTEPVKEQIVFTSDGSQIVKTQEPVNAYQCINPGTGKYETHYDYEFQKYQDMIYVKYNAK